MRSTSVTSTLLLIVGLLSSLLPGDVLAQKGVKISLPPAKVADNDPQRLFYIDSVYTTFPDTAAIGTVYRPMLGDMQPAYLKDGVSKSVEQWLFTHFPSFRPSQRPVHLQIDQLTYLEDPTQGYELEAELTFFQQDSTRQFVPFYKATIETATGGFGRGGNIAEQLLRAIGQMNAYLNDPAKRPNYLDDHEEAMRKAAVDMKLDTARYAAELTPDDNLLTCKQKREGIYLNEEDLIRNRPALIGALETVSRKETTSLIRPDKRRSRYRFLGFCLAGDLYINTSLYGGNRAVYTRVLDIGPYLLWRGNYVTMAERSTNAAAVGAAGLVGGLIAAAATNYRDCIAIDTRTGKLMQVTPEALRSILADTPALLAEYETAEKAKKSDTIYEFMVRHNQELKLQAQR